MGKVIKEAAVFIMEVKITSQADKARQN